MDTLVVALPVFFASAVTVVAGGIGLAHFGDELAKRTGWGHLWVGTILVAVGTSLPELFTNISAVSIGSPELALGNVFGANMVNMWVLGMVVLFFGARRFFGGVNREIVVLAAVALLLGGLALSMSIEGASVGLGIFSLGGLLIGLGYIVGMRAVYSVSSNLDGVEPENGHSLPRVWLLFLGSVTVIGAAAPFLAFSADGIADASGLSTSFMGVLAVSLVTTLPEATVTVVAARRGLYSLAIGNLYGSCIFNVAIIAVIDPVNGNRPVLEAMDPEHFAAGGVMAALMGLGLLAMWLNRLPAAWLRAPLIGMAAIYPAGLLWVFALAQ